MKSLKYSAAVVAVAAMLVGSFAAPAFATRNASPVGNAHSGKATFFVSPSGSDTNPGTRRQPFQHIQQCAATMTAGDTCQIASGTYRETVTPKNSGTASARIRYTAAPGATVTIDGTEPVTGFSQVSGANLSALESTDSFLAGSPFALAATAGHIYQTSVVLNPSLAGNQIFEDGAAQVPAQWPYPGTNPVTPIFEWAQAGASKSVTDSAAVRPDGYWNGARLTASVWFDTETGTVTDSSAGTITASGMPGCLDFQPSTAGKTHYSLSGKLEELSHAGEWFYNAVSHTLYQWSTDSKNPASHMVEAKARTLGFDLTGRSYISLDGVGLRATTLQTSDTSTGVDIDGMKARYVSAYDDLAVDPNIVSDPSSCDILTAGETTSGIILAGTANTLRNSSVSWSSGNGVVVSGSANTVTNTVISNVDSGASYAAGINILGANQTITHNTVSNSGRSSINIDNKVASKISAGHKIAYNDLSRFNTLSIDSGAIYVCCNVDLATTTIDHNNLHDATPPAFEYPDSLDAEVGLYLDNGTFNATVYDNVGWNNFPTGTIAINGDSTGNRVYNNTNAFGPKQGKAVSFFSGTHNSTEIVNNIGDVQPTTGATVSNNLPSSIDPQFVNAAAGNFQLKGTSPARSAGVVRPPATDGYKGSAPSEGAYQFGVAPWRAGALWPGESR